MGHIVSGKELVFILSYVCTVLQLTKHSFLFSSISFS